jgi:hypothetical protein
LLPGDNPVVLVCKTDRRSAQAAAELLAAGLLSPSFVAEPTGGTGKGWHSNNEHPQPSTIDSGARIDVDLASGSCAVGRIRLKLPLTGDHDLAIAEQRSKLGDMDCERPLNIPHSAVVPPSTNSKAPVT